MARMNFCIQSNILHLYILTFTNVFTIVNILTYTFVMIQYPRTFIKFA